MNEYSRFTISVLRMGDCDIKQQQSNGKQKESKKKINKYNFNIIA